MKAAEVGFGLDPRVSPMEWIESSLQQIDRWEPHIHAWVSVEAEFARAQAQQFTQEAEAGRQRGNLHGVPVGIKDIFDVAGWPTRAGSRVLAETPVPQDAVLVAQLRRAGAILLGKTVTTEFACFDPPPTCNPWNVKHTPGGSSSGSAAAVATGGCALALGSQTGGSLTRPATYCGVCSYKPTVSRWSTEGVVPISHTLDHPGVIARRVADLRRVAAALDPCGDRFQTELPETWRVGLIDGLLEQAAPEVQRLIRQIGDHQEISKRLHRHPQPAVLPLEDIWEMHRRIMRAEAAQYHRTWFPQRRRDYGPNLTAMLEDGWKVLAVEYLEALEHRKRVRQSFLRAHPEVDLWLAPATEAAAPATRETTGDPHFQSMWSYLGLPTVSLSVGLDSDGLPLGVQLIGRPEADDSLLAAAEWIDTHCGIGGRIQPTLNQTSPEP